MLPAVLDRLLGVTVGDERWRREREVEREGLARAQDDRVRERETRRPGPSNVCVTFTSCRDVTVLVMLSPTVIAAPA